MNKKLEITLRWIGTILLVYSLCTLFYKEHPGKTDRIIQAACYVILLLANANLIKETFTARKR